MGILMEQKEMVKKPALIKMQEIIKGHEEEKWSSNQFLYAFNNNASLLFICINFYAKY